MGAPQNPQGVQPGAQYPPQAGPSGGYPVPARPIGTQEAVGKVILLSIVTLGIYYLIWLYRRAEELKVYTGNGLGGTVALILGIFVGFVPPFMLSSETAAAYQAEGRQSPVSAATGAWILLPLIGAFIWLAKEQAALNQFWGSKGAPPPA